MKLTHIKGNTWCLEDWEKIPVYITEDRRAILIDTGLSSQREAIERILRENDLTPGGLLTTHIHVDHCGNHRYFQEKYHIPVAASFGEAGLAATLSTYKAYLFMFTPGKIRRDQDLSDMVMRPDLVIMPEDDEVRLAGVSFKVLHTPGHSPDHISFITPDGVCAMGDALMAGQDFARAKVPYYAVISDALETLDRLKDVQADRFIISHCDITDDIYTAAIENASKILKIAGEIRDLADRPMTMDQIYRAACSRYHMVSGQFYKAGLYERNLRSYVEYLVDTGELKRTIDGGVICYQRQ